MDKAHPLGLSQENLGNLGRVEHQEVGLPHHGELLVVAATVRPPGHLKPLGRGHLLEDICPGELTGVVVGYVYGKVFGFFLSTLGLTLGSWIAFEVAHGLGRPFVEKFVRKEILEKFDFVTSNTGTLVCFLLFLLPGFPKDYLCYLLGLSRMSMATFMIVSTIGRMPGTYFLTIQGASLRSQEYFTAVIFALISAAIIFLAYLYRVSLFHWLKHKKGDFRSPG